MQHADPFASLRYCRPHVVGNVRGLLRARQQRYLLFLEGTAAGLQQKEKKKRETEKGPSGLVVTI